MRGVAERTTEIWEASRESGTCRGCGAPITWAKVVKSKKWMPFTGRVDPIRQYQHDSGRMIDVVDLTRSHFATCPAADTFRKKRTR